MYSRRFRPKLRKNRSRMNQGFFSDRKSSPTLMKGFKNQSQHVWSCERAPLPLPVIAWGQVRIRTHGKTHKELMWPQGRAVPRGWGNECSQGGGHGLPESENGEGGEGEVGPAFDTSFSGEIHDIVMYGILGDPDLDGGGTGPERGPPSVPRASFHSERSFPRRWANFLRGIGNHWSGRRYADETAANPLPGPDSLCMDHLSEVVVV